MVRTFSTYYAPVETAVISERKLVICTSNVTDILSLAYVASFRN